MHSKLVDRLHLTKTCVGHVYVSEHDRLIQVCRANRRKAAYKKNVIEAITWTITTSGGGHCFWNLTEANETFAKRLARYRRDLS